MSVSAPIYFHYQVPFNFPQRRAAKSIIAQIFKDHNLRLKRLDYIFCSDDQLLQINQQFLQHDTFTDIITFPLDDDPSALIGEIYISVDRVRENARSFCCSFLEELSRVLFHGALHLCGYDDHNPQDIVAIRSAESKYLALRFT